METVERASSRGVKVILLPPKPAIRPVTWFWNIISLLVFRQFPLRVEMAPFYMPVEEAYVHTGWLGIVLQMACAVIQLYLIERPAGHHAEIAIRIIRATLVPCAERGVHTEFP